MRKLSKLVSLMLSVVLCIGMAAPAFAIEYNIAVGNVHIENDDNGTAVSWQDGHKEHGSKEQASTDTEITITGEYASTKQTTDGGHTIIVGENVETTITLRDVNIDVTECKNKYDSKVVKKSPLSIGDGSDVTVNLEGTNVLKNTDSWNNHSGLRLGGDASVTITSTTGGSLQAEGAAAGIGGGRFDRYYYHPYYTPADSITIDGNAQVEAKGEVVGIGGCVDNITISGEAKVDAKGNTGIGSMYDEYSPVDSIVIEGNAVVNAEGSLGAGIGSSSNDEPDFWSDGGHVGSITIGGNADVTAKSTEGGAGIGSGCGGSVDSITIGGNATVNAEGGSNEGYGNDWYGEYYTFRDPVAGAGIGSGGRGTVGNITIKDNANVTARGGSNDAASAAAIGSGTGGYFESTEEGPMEEGEIIPASAGNITVTTTGKLELTGNDVDPIDAGSINSSVGVIEVRHIDEEGDLWYIHFPGGGPDTDWDGWTEFGITPPEDEQITVNPDLSVTIPVGSEGPFERIGDGGTITVIGEGEEPGEDDEIYGTVKFTPGEHDYDVTVTKEASCKETGSQKYTCKNCGHSYDEPIGKLSHTPGDPVHENEVSAQIGVEGSYDEVVYCTVCDAEISRKSVTVPALEAPQPETPDPGDFTPAVTTTLADQEVPLAGLMPLYMLLEELRQHEEIPEIELPEDFKWINHEYAQAIYWGLQEELVVDTEEKPLDPDEVLTVGRMREVLVNFVERYLGLDDFVVTLEGEDDEIVMDLGARLTAFYAELDAALKAQESKAA